jgi:hypothetical protein
MGTMASCFWQGFSILILPSHSPELQPAERLWPLSNEPLANRVWTWLDELEQVQTERSTTWVLQRSASWIARLWRASSLDWADRSWREA